MGKARNVILVGYMGTGKTTVGQRVARGLGFAFVDTDDAIERECGKSIPEIFTQEGEERFRERETAVLRETLTREDQVISTGGGIVLREENRVLLGQGGYCVWLTADAEEILARVRGSNHRPLLRTEDPLGTIRRMLAEREPYYEEVADLTLASGELHPDDLAYGICESARVHFHESA